MPDLHCGILVDSQAWVTDKMIRIQHSVFAEQALCDHPDMVNIYALVFFFYIKNTDESLKRCSSIYIPTVVYFYINF